VTSPRRHGGTEKIVSKELTSSTPLQARQAIAIRSEYEFRLKVLESLKQEMLLAADDDAKLQHLSELFS
jgi:hypothetical protein